jgi:hypothetical protein
MTRSVFAVDPVTSGVSIARIIEGDPVPRTAYDPAPEVGEHPDLHTASRRAEAQAAAVVKKVTAAEPAIVMLPHLFIGSVNNDPSGPRRAGVYWSIVRLLDEAGIQVADFPPLATQRYAGLNAQPGFKSVDRLAESVKRRWPGANRAMPPGFRYSTVMLAAVGCAAVGIGTAVEVSPARLRLMKSGTWPGSVKLARGVDEWRAMHRVETRLGMVGEDEDDAVKAAVG